MVSVEKLRAKFSIADSVKKKFKYCTAENLKANFTSKDLAILSFCILFSSSK